MSGEFEGALILFSCLWWLAIFFKKEISFGWRTRVGKGKEADGIALGMITWGKLIG